MSMLCNLTLVLLLLFVDRPASAIAAVRIVRCMEGGDCPLSRGEEASAWSPAHEDLYWKGTAAVLEDIACEQLSESKYRLAYQATRAVATRCGKGRRIPRATDPTARTRLLLKNRADYVLEFRRGNAMAIDGGLEVKMSVAYWGRSGKRGVEPALEGVASYAVLQIGEDVEVRVLSTLAL